MYAAVEASKSDQDVMILSKGKIGLSGSSLVSMSVHRYAPLEPSLKKGYRDNLLLSGRKINDPLLMDVLIEQGAQKVEALESYGLSLLYKSKIKEGKPIRYLACGETKKGKYLTMAMRSYLESKTNVKMLEGYMALDLVVNEGKVSGIITEKENKLYFVAAKAVVLATGGAGYVYKCTSNTSDLTGDGYAMALKVGLELQDMEFVQFYPYRIYAPRKIDIFPDIFAHGARFINEKGERFMALYPKKELENRDVLARCMYAQEEVILDLSQCDQKFLAKECPDIYEAYHSFKGKKFLVKPVAHFMMGGIPLQPDCSTKIFGLFCCGEVTGGLHGANRMAGSALTETAVFGPMAGSMAAKYASINCCESVSTLNLDWNTTALIGDDDATEVMKKTRELMWECASIVRTDDSLGYAKDGLEQLEDELMKQKPKSLRRWLECKNLILIGKCIVTAALLRQESRGAHYRRDQQFESKEWDGNIIISEKDVCFKRRIAD